MILKFYTKELLTFQNAINNTKKLVTGSNNCDLWGLTFRLLFSIELIQHGISRPILTFGNSSNSGLIQLK